MSPGSAHRSHRIRIGVATAGMAVLALIWCRLWSGDSQPMVAGESAISRSEGRAPPVEAAPQSPEEKLKAQFLGIWFHSENGQQWIENRPDGTARMLLKLDFISSLLYGQETHMDLTWDVKDGMLTHTVIGGTPVANVDKIVKDFGKSLQYAILETTAERMLLESKNDKQKDLWTRSPAPPEWAK
jgi:hypothetical protein